MATVRLTNNLRERLGKAARDLFETPLKNAQNMPVGDPFEIYNRMFGEYTDRIKALPIEFFRWSDMFNIVKINGYRYNLKYDLHLVAPFPAGKFDTDTIQNDYGGLLDFTLKGEQWTDLLVLASKRNDSIEKVLDKRAGFVNTLNNLLAAHTTVNSALKEWPALKDLLPEHVLQAIEAPAEKRVNKHIKSNVDTTMLTGIVVANKLAR
jgi:hypothetical protein